MPFLERLTSPGGARLRSTLRGQRALVHRPRLLPPRLLLDVVPNLGGSEVLAAEGMCVNLRGGGDGRVAEAFADGRQVHMVQLRWCGPRNTNDVPLKCGRGMNARNWPQGLV